MSASESIGSKTDIQERLVLTGCARPARLQGAAAHRSTADLGFRLRPCVNAEGRMNRPVDSRVSALDGEERVRLAIGPSS